MFWSEDLSLSIDFGSFLNSCMTLLVVVAVWLNELTFILKTMKHDITKAIQFSNTFRYIDDLFNINNVDFGNYISAIYPPEL